ncbi:MAG: ABC transporter ATP-binding protein [Myxococcales bacterium]|nr:ABC transporter ATP-binding protein [Myxococcales bacterium]
MDSGTSARKIDPQGRARTAKQRPTRSRRAAARGTRRGKVRALIPKSSDALEGIPTLAIDAVRAHQIVKTFGATAALRGVDVVLLPGRLNRIEGANGSGKTTLLRVLGTLLAPSSGTVEYAPLGTDSRRARPHLGWVSHEPFCYADLSGRRNVELAAQFHGMDVRAAWGEVSERFQLGRAAERPLGTNSRGQRQRVALARALVHRPAVVLLDEPTTGLDRQGVAQLVRVVEQELARGAIVALVSHDPEPFGACPQARFVLERGRVVDGR